MAAETTPSLEIMDRKTVQLEDTFDQTPSVLQQSEHWKSFQQDLLEPQFYPDPVLFRASLEKITRDERELKKILKSNEALHRVLAPYLRTIQRDQKRIHEAIREREPKTKKIIYDKKTKQDTSGVVPDISEKMEMILSIHETADILKVLAKATNLVSYIVNPTTNELYQSPRHVVSSTSKLTTKIEPGTTIAAYAAFSKQYIISNSVHSDPRFPLGLGFSSSMVKYALCVPIKTPEESVVAVYELTRDAFEVAFDKRDVQLVLALTGWMGVAIHQNSLYSTTSKQFELTNYLIQLTNHYHSQKADVDRTLSDIVIFARETIGAERCYLYVVDKKSKTGLIVEEYEQGVDNQRLLFKRRTKKHVEHDFTPLCRVLLDNQIVNTHEDPSENTAEQETTSRSVICVPIKCGEEMIGAIKLVNKRVALAFNKEDQEILQKFASFCALNINHVKVHNRLKKAEIQNNINYELLFYHMKPCPHDQEAMRRISESLPEHFFTLSWYPSPDQIPKLAELTINMFHEVLGDSFMALNNVSKFVLTVQNCYRPNPYHNFIHAFCVTHTMANIISRYHKIFTGIERKALMVAALCHDVDHRGYTNNFLQLTKHYLASLYDSSPLENHHFAVTKMILHQCNMFKYIKPEIFNDLLSEIYENIIATDLSLYFQCRMELLKIADEKTFTFKNNSHRRLVKSLMMTACDLAGQTKPLYVSSKITDDVYEEFFLQGDLEKKMGYVPLPTMDRDKKDMIAENQVQFLSVVVIPCIETVTRIFSTLSPMVWETRALLKQWKELIEIKDQNLWKPEESVKGDSG